MHTIQNGSVAVILATLCATPAAAWPPESEKELHQAVWDGRFLAAVALYEKLALGDGEPTPQTSYLAGLAYWKLHQAEKAEPLIKRASERKFRAGGGRPQPDELLGKIEEFIAAKPSSVNVPELDRAVIDAYADAKNYLSLPILDALPRFVEIGRDIFEKPPPVRFFLFGRSPAMQRLYGALDITLTRSTGTTNLVVVCEEKAHRATEAETISMALHEMTHAWQATYLRVHYDRQIHVPAYVDEGLAVYVSTLWSPELRQLAQPRLKQWRQKGAVAPAFEALKRFEDFHGGSAVSVNYLLSGLLMERMLGPPETGAKRLPALFDAFASQSDDIAVWRQVAGKNVRAEYDAMIGELWNAEAGAPPSPGTR